MMPGKWRYQRNHVAAVVDWNYQSACWWCRCWRFINKDKDERILWIDFKMMDRHPTTFRLSDGFDWFWPARYLCLSERQHPNRTCAAGNHVQAILAFISFSVLEVFFCCFFHVCFWFVVIWNFPFDFHSERHPSNGLRWIPKQNTNGIISE